MLEINYYCTGYIALLDCAQATAFIFDWRAAFIAARLTSRRLKGDGGGVRLRWLLWVLIQFEDLDVYFR